MCCSSKVVLLYLDLQNHRIQSGCTFFPKTVATRLIFVVFASVGAYSAILNLASAVTLLFFLCRASIFVFLQVAFYLLAKSPPFMLSVLHRQLVLQPLLPLHEL